MSFFAFSFVLKKIYSGPWVLDIELICIMSNCSLRNELMSLNCICMAAGADNALSKQEACTALQES